MSFPNLLDYFKCSETQCTIDKNNLEKLMVNINTYNKDIENRIRNIEKEVTTCKSYDTRIDTLERKV